MSRWTPVAVMGLLACATTLDPAVAEEPPASCPEIAQDPAVPDYDRRSWGRWVDADGDCQDSRQEILVRDSTDPVTFKDDGQCKVATGTWIDPYDGRVVTDPSTIDIDHVIALRDAHDSGAWEWDRVAKIAFANDLANLKASSRSTNRSKGAKGADEWLPPKPEFRCGYVAEWLALKEKAALTTTEGESAVVGYMTRVCGRGEAPPLPQN